jgi:site-specific recombinase XerD
MYAKPVHDLEVPSDGGWEALERYVPAFMSRLLEQGYSAASIHSRLQVIRNFSRWISMRQAKLGQLHDGSVDLFFRQQPRAGHVRRGDLALLRKFILYLRRIGVTPPAPQQIDESESGRLERLFSRYLLEERGLSEATLSNYLPVVHRFLTERFSSDVVELSEIGVSDVIAFVRRQAHAMGGRRAQLMTAALRSFFRFLRSRGDVITDLSACVPAVADWRLTTLPKALVPKEVRILVQSCDRSTTIGRRDYAILLILVRLGLRAGEIVAMELEHIDWDSGTLTVHGKGGRQDRLPIPHDVGEALAAYICHGRPRCTTRRVFIRARAPHCGFSGSAAIDDVVRRSLDRAELDPDHKGAHLLRHSLATDMLRHGATLAEIGEILRHSSPSSTEIYAKVDLTALTALAQPWPGGGA